MKPIKEDQHIRFEGGDRFKEYCENIFTPKDLYVIDKYLDGSDLFIALKLFDAGMHFVNRGNSNEYNETHRLREILRSARSSMNRSNIYIYRYHWITKDGYNKFYWAKKFYLELKNKEL